MKTKHLYAVKMYPNVDTAEVLASLHRQLVTNPSPLGLSPDTVEWWAGSPRILESRKCTWSVAVQWQQKYEYASDAI